MSLPYPGLILFSGDVKIAVFIALGYRFLSVVANAADAGGVNLVDGAHDRTPCLFLPFLKQIQHIVQIDFFSDLQLILRFRHIIQ